MKLMLGFESFPYSARYTANSPLPSLLKARKPRVMTPTHTAYGAGKTTGQVSKELEERYKIVEEFWKFEEDSFVEILEEAFAEDLEDVMQMKKLTKQTRGISVKETDQIEQRFRQNLSARRYDGIISGVPTLAAQRGVSHMRAQPYSRKNPPRASFVDTGMYQRSFRAWVEDVEE
jgi:hypothetical protein